MNKKRTAKYNSPAPRTVKDFVRGEYYEYTARVLKGRFKIPDQDLDDVVQELLLRLHKFNYLSNYAETYPKEVNGETVMVKGAIFKTYLYKLISSVACAYYRGNFKRNADGTGTHTADNLYNSFSFDYMVEGSGDGQGKSFLDTYVDETGDKFEDVVVRNDFFNSLRGYLRRQGEQSSSKATQDSPKSRLTNIERVFDMLVYDQYNATEIATELEIDRRDIVYLINKIRSFAETYLQRCNLTAYDIIS